MILQRFGLLVPIVPALGNLEVSPANLYIPESITEKDKTLTNEWLYAPLVATIWSPTFRNEAARKAFRRGGFYSRELTPNWRVIILNSNTPAKANWWNLYGGKDADGQLAWLVSELQAAETAGQYVTITGHVPPKSEYMIDVWLHNYIRIVDRFQHVITGTYFGHTHKDELVVLYNKEKKPVSVAFVSGSISPYGGVNPMYSIFEIDGQTGTMIAWLWNTHVYHTSWIDDY